MMLKNHINTTARTSERKNFYVKNTWYSTLFCAVLAFITTVLIWLGHL